MPEEMLKAQNMEGYHDTVLHTKTADLLRNGASIMEAVRFYRSKDNPKRRLKRILLTASAVLPDVLRAKLKKRFSSHRLQGI